MRPGLHQALLGLVLAALLTITGSQAVWSADEGALLHQISSLADGGGWSFDHPYPEADPDGTRYPLHLSSWAVDGSPAPGTVAAGCPVDGVGCRYVSLAKHTTYLWITTGLYALGGYTALLALSVLGTLAAAIGASRLAARIEPAAELPALWLVGIGSPLLFNAYVAWAHTPTAALVVWSVHWLTTNRVGSRRIVDLGAGTAALFAACLLRTEAPLAGLALGFGWIGIAVVLRRIGRPDRTLLTSGLAALSATAIGLVVDRATATPTDGPVTPPSFDEAFGLIDGRLEGFANTWLRPAYVMGPMDLLLVVSAVALIATAIFVRRGPEGRALAVPTVLIALGCVAVRFVLAPAATVPGLLIACPILIVGLILLDRETVTERATLATLVPFVLFCGAVLATQYRGGGGGEWGGRYFAIGLPLGLAVATVGLIRAGRLFQPPQRRQLVLMLSAGVLLLNLLGLFGLRETRNRTDDLAATVTGTAVTAGDGDDRPVVVTTVNGLGRWLWEDLDSLRMLRVTSEELPDVGAQLAELDVQRLTLVSLDPDDDLQLISSWYDLDPQDASVDGASTATVPGAVLTLTRS